MDQQAIHAYLVATFAGVETSTAYGYTFYFQGADRMLPFATLATSDDEYDRASRLDRPSVYRLNIGVHKDTYRSLFGAHPAPPAAGEVVATGHDFAALDVLMPHPIYAYTSWVAVLSPSEATFERVKPLLAEAHAIAVRREQRK